MRQLIAALLALLLGAAMIVAWVWYGLYAALIVGVVAWPCLWAIDKYVRLGGR